MRKNILAKFLNCPVDRIYIADYYENCYTDTNAYYLVLTEKEADEEAKKELWNYIWSFDIDFLIKYLSIRVSKEEFEKLLARSCDNCLLIISALIVDYEGFIDEAIRRYGRSYFLWFEDKTEYRVKYGKEEFLVYRVG